MFVFVEIRTAEMTEPMRGIYSLRKNNLSFRPPFSGARGAISQTILQSHPFPIAHP